jgi:hypothetical protein
LARLQEKSISGSDGRGAPAWRFAWSDHGRKPVQVAEYGSRDGIVVERRRNVGGAEDSDVLAVFEEVERVVGQVLEGRCACGDEQRPANKGAQATPPHFQRAELRCAIGCRVFERLRVEGRAAKARRAT